MITAMDQQRNLEPPSVVGSVERMIDTGQRLLIERIDLARLEAEDAIARGLRTAMLVVIGGTVAFTGWLALMACMVVALRDHAGFPAATSILVVALAHTLAGGALVLYAFAAPAPSGHRDVRA